MKKLSYKAGITGLFLYALGAALFWPAAEVMNYTLFLIGLFIIAAGLGCLETAANPFVTVLGPESGGHFRLNLAQTFNSFGAIIAVVFLGKVLFCLTCRINLRKCSIKWRPNSSAPMLLVLGVIGTVLLYDHRRGRLTGRSADYKQLNSQPLQSDDHSDVGQSSFSARFPAWCAFATGVGGTGAVLLRRRANRLLELSDSLRYRRDPRHDPRLCRQLSDRHHGVLLYRSLHRYLVCQPLSAPHVPQPTPCLP